MLLASNSLYNAGSINFSINNPSADAALLIATAFNDSGAKIEYNFDNGKVNTLALTTTTSVSVPVGAKKLNITKITFKKKPVESESFITIGDVSNANNTLITAIDNWSDYKLEGLKTKNCGALTKLPTSLWPTCTSLKKLLSRAITFNQSLSGWNTANVTDMSWVFEGCSVFNQPLTGWDTSNVTSMYAMFYGCSAFNQTIAHFIVSKVTDLSYLFSGCTAFNQNLSTMIFKSTTTRTAYNAGTNAWNAAYYPKFTG